MAAMITEWVYQLHCARRDYCYPAWQVLDGEITGKLEAYSASLHDGQEQVLTTETRLGVPTSSITRLGA
jgi:hypothetical protein